MLQLAVKQYIPPAEADTTSGDAITIIGMHGIGFPKVWCKPHDYKKPHHRLITCT